MRIADSPLGSPIRFSPTATEKCVGTEGVSLSRVLLAAVGGILATFSCIYRDVRQITHADRINFADQP